MTEQNNQSMAIANTQDGVVIHSFDNKPPMLKLAQSNSSFGEPGQFFRTDTEESFDEIEIVPLRVQALVLIWNSKGYKP